MFFSLLQSPTELLVWAIVAHLAADWLFQTNWMAIHKTKLRHPASWVHAGVYTLCMAIVFPLYMALLIGVAHLLVDLRTPVRWWVRAVKGMPDGSPGLGMVEMGVDQTIHVMVLAGAVLVLAVL